MRSFAGFALTICQSGAGDRSTRAMSGARLLGQAIEARLGVKAAIIGEMTAPVDGTWQEELAVARPRLRPLVDSLESEFATERTPITTLSRCAVALATLPVVARHRPDTCIVWFDAHGDINTPDTTKSGYLGGMVVTGAAGLWDSGLGGDLNLSNVVLVGARDIDPAERALIDAGAPTLVTAGPNLAQRLRSAIADRAIYVHIDCDVLEPGLVPTEYRVAGGLTFDDLRDACRVLAGNEVVGLEIAELEAAPGDARVASSIAGLLDALEPLITRIAHR
jgi:arginase